jgi:hypothetical protein
MREYLKEYDFIGDSIVETYSVDFENKKLSMLCVHWCGQDNSERKETTVEFDNVLTHLFVGINNKGNVLFDIVEATLDDLYSQFGHILDGYHFDFSSKDKLAKIVNDKYRIFLLNSSFGLYGMVISESINFLYV